MPEVPSHPAIREANVTPVHRIPIRERERYWRSVRHWKSVKHARNRCSTLTQSVNHEGDAQWVIRSWAAKWNVSAAEVRARLHIADYLEGCGQHLSVVLWDGDRRVAGTTNILKDNYMVASVLYRDTTVGSMPSGVRAIDATLQCAQDAGVEVFDFGGGHSYKQKWAPSQGEHRELLIGPAPTYQATKALRRVRDLKDSVKRATIRASHSSKDPAPASG